MTCVICKQSKKGSCIQCNNKSCSTSFHVECARRSNYFMEYHFESDSGEVFCQRHSPFPMLKEINRSERAQLEELVNYAGVFEQSQSLAKNVKKWSDKDKKELLTKVQRVYLQLRKMKITLFKDKNKKKSAKEKSEEADDEFG